MSYIKAEDWGSVVRPARRDNDVAKASAATGAILQLAGPGPAVWHLQNYQQFAKEGYTENTEAHACINLLATAVKGIDFKVYQKQKSGKRKALDTHPLLDLIERPNEYTSGSAFWEGWVTYLLCAGNAYVERVGPRPGAPPRELWLQRPDRMYVIPGKPDDPACRLVAGYKYQTWYEQESGKTPQWIPDEMRVNGIPRQPVQRILHSKFFNPVNDFYGLSPLQVAGRAIDQINSSMEWNVSLLQNSARPSGLLTLPGASEEQRADFEDRFNRKHSGRANAGKTVITNSDEAKYVRLSSTAQEMDWAAGQGLSTERICAVFKVPPELIGQSSHRTYQNWAEARKSFYMESALPLVDFLLAEFNYWLQPFFGEDVEIGYDKQDIEALQEDRQYIATRALDAFQKGAITRNMYLKAVGEDALPPETGDVFLVPTTVVPTKLDGTPVAKPVRGAQLEPATVGDRAITTRPPAAPATDPIPARPQLVPRPARTN